MRDTVITAERKRIELRTAGVCLLLAVLLNIGCILYYHTPFYEVFTQVGYTLMVTLTLYLIWTVLRLIVRTFRRKKK